jgi:hypothetical protein
MTHAEAFAKYWGDNKGVGAPFIVLTERFVLSAGHSLVHVCPKYDEAHDNYVRLGFVPAQKQRPNGHYLQRKDSFHCPLCNAEVPDHLKAMQTLYLLDV